MDDVPAAGSSNAAKALLGGAIVFLIAGVALTPLWGMWSGDSDTDAGFGLAFLSLSVGVVAATVTTILRGMNVALPRRRVVLIAVVTAPLCAVCLQPLAALARRALIGSCDYGPNNPEWCLLPDPQPPGHISLSYGIAGAVIAIAVCVVGLLPNRETRHPASG